MEETAVTGLLLQHITAPTDIRGCIIIGVDSGTGILERDQQDQDQSSQLQLSQFQSQSQTPEHLWEIIKFVRRERDISNTRREILESESVRQTQLIAHLERQLGEARAELREVSDAAKSQTETAAQHAEVLAKVQGHVCTCVNK